MVRIAGMAAAAVLVAGLAGCCCGPMRFYQNAYGFNNPNIEHYPPGPPAPVITPPGMTVPAVPKLPGDLESPDV